MADTWWVEEGEGRYHEFLALSHSGCSKWPKLAYLIGYDQLLTILYLLEWSLISLKEAEIQCFLKKPMLNRKDLNNYSLVLNLHSWARFPSIKWPQNSRGSPGELQGLDILDSFQFIFRPSLGMEMALVTLFVLRRDLHSRNVPC